MPKTLELPAYMFDCTADTVRRATYAEETALAYMSERDRLELSLRLASPKRAAKEQADAGDLSLFVQANEPKLI